MTGPGVLALVGGDEFRPGCEPMDRAVLAATGRPRPMVLVVPTAAAFTNPGKAAQNGVAYFRGLGADANGLMVLGHRDANDEALIGAVEGADVVYLTGGDPVHLLSTLMGSPLLTRLLAFWRRGGLLAGSSAGAMAMGGWMRHRGWTRALGIATGVAVLPHHERADPVEVARALDAHAPERTTVLGIGAMTCVLGGPGTWTIEGPGPVVRYERGHRETYAAGDTMQL